LDECGGREEKGKGKGFFRSRPFSARATFEEAAKSKRGRREKGEKNDPAQGIEKKKGTLQFLSSTRV